MKINQDNFVKELRRGNEKALLYVIVEYGGLLRSVIRRQLFALPDRLHHKMQPAVYKSANHTEMFQQDLKADQNQDDPSEDLRF